MKVSSPVPNLPGWPVIPETRLPYQNVRHNYRARMRIKHATGEFPGVLRGCSGPNDAEDRQAVERSMLPNNALRGRDSKWSMNELVTSVLETFLPRQRTLLRRLPSSYRAFRRTPTTSVVGEGAERSTGNYVTPIWLASWARCVPQDATKCGSGRNRYVRRRGMSTLFFQVDGPKKALLYSSKVPWRTTRSKRNAD